MAGVLERLKHKTAIYVENINTRTYKRLLDEGSTRFAIVFLLFVLFLALFGPTFVPYDYDERVRGSDGQLITNEGPSLDHPLGTTDQAYDVLSRVVYGAQPTVTAGLMGGTMIITIGLLVGLTSGYVGGRVDSVLMRITDVIYGIPLIPFALVLVSIIGIGFYQSVLVIGLVLWRGSARVLRSQTLQIKERPFVLAVKATGASTPYIIRSHILPNVMPMAFLFFALGTGYTILIQAGLAFLGVSNPFVPSWGIMIRNAYNSGVMTLSWWWAIAPGMLIALTVLSLFMIGRGLEEATGEGGGESLAQGG